MTSISTYRPSSDAKYEIDIPVCQLCLDLLQALFTGTWVSRTRLDQKHHETRDALECSARNGCPICQMLAREMEYMDYDKYKVNERFYTPNQGFYYQFWITPISGGPSVVVPIALLRGAMIPGAKFVLSAAFPQLNFGGPFVVPVPNSYPTTDENLEVTRGWMSRCSNDHAVCTRTRGNGPLPRRVLDISNADQGSVTLYQSNRQEIAPYATASYCWGTTPALKTTVDNLEQHCKGIELSSIPETLRDVIVFARALRFSYLWIDALCIVQGDGGDWAEHANSMTDIYHNCILNIAVSDAPNGNSGVIRKWKDSAVRIGKASTSIMPESEIFAVSGVVPVYPTYAREIPTHLSKRGWVFQETLVSAATLYITSRGLGWACCSERCPPGECMIPYPSLEEFGDRPIDKRAWARDVELCGEATLDSESKLIQLRRLYGWVREISKGRLTYPTDKLPCIAGLVSRIATATSATYVAGLWKEDIAAGLTWFALYQQPLTRHKDGAPSWSWSSVDGRLDYPNPFLRDNENPGILSPIEGLELELVDAIVDGIDPGPFGRVRAARLTVCGTIWPGTLRTVADPQGTKRTMLDGPFDNIYRAIPFIDELRDWGKGTSCWILGLTRIYEEKSWRGRRWYYLFFLVIEETGVSTNQFRRLGLLQADTELDQGISEPGIKRTLVLV
ncbi:heterokaryon incompatibility protein-domain-containing protein [Cladorrhinum sp. PSN259]|nr:heterokaryon incompatibility protein-domain-containing protein [Cladorrhinum sp. PSN259]